MSAALPLPGITVVFTPEEYAMLARIADAGMWEMASQPHTTADAALWDRVCEKLGMPGYTAEDRAANREGRAS